VGIYFAYWQGSALMFKIDIDNHSQWKYNSKREDDIENRYQLKY
jgi:hypothetical protein